MDGLERRYKVKLIKKYELDKEKTDRTILFEAIEITILTGLAALVISKGGMEARLVLLLLGLCNIQAVVSLAKSIAKLAVLNIRIEDLENALKEEKAYQNGESVGRSR